MIAIWQLLEAVIIPILHMDLKGGTLNKKEEEQIQTMLNKTIKNILFLTMAPSSTVLCAGTGFVQIRHIMNKKILQGYRIDSNRGKSLIQTIKAPGKSL